MKKLVILSALIISTFAVSAQDFNKKKIVNRLADIMNRNYVYPEKGEAMSELIKGKLKDNAYEQFTTKESFADALQEDLRSIINDKHIRVVFDSKRAKSIRNRDYGPGPESNGKFGFEEVKILEGNIGYLDLRGFMNIGQAEDVAKPAMDKLIKSDAIIFDLRKNGGGSPSMIRFISSYLFGNEPVHLNTFYWRPSDNYSKTWTDPKLASETKPNIPVYVLTSDYTFSAAEEFTYNLKHMGRATIIGETTGGGAHPGGPSIIDGDFIVNVPRGRAINPVTKTNWEGKGVKPHIQTDEENALDKAIELARKAIASK
ncbi:S41 family peptidase [Roseivirga sp. E12]|uniref:S41 family peptidase n=1 Tax=Roseivirga sp. E12 TaxID=2819237 RepID=UPI001ABCD1D3|nr:S41 family peptidase [Roseivirga sp. E12]MBO3699637.1 S41 family peptidase [Roseivirga sp. E12]